MRQFKIEQKFEREIIGETIADNEPFGTRDYIEYARMLRDIEES